MANHDEERGDAGPDWAGLLRRQSFDRPDDELGQNLAPYHHDALGEFVPPPSADASRELAEMYGYQDLSADALHEQVAAQGMSGTGEPLPFASQIQASFGAHDISGARAFMDSRSSDAAGRLDAQAFTLGNRVAFAGAPDLHTAAHEAAHVVQQAQGVKFYGGTGAAGDSYERHADAVADRVVAGQSAEALLGATNAPSYSSSAASTGSAVQFKKVPGPGASSSSVSTEELEQQIAMLNEQSELLAARMTNRKVLIDADDRKLLLRSLQQQRTIVLNSIKKSPKGSSLAAKGKAAVERAQHVSDRLKEFGQAQDAHTAVEKRFGHDDGIDHLQGAREKHEGYCDHDGQANACHLSEGERNLFRDVVRNAVTRLASSWAQAINDAYLDEMFKAKQITFEQQLGEVLLGILFGVIGSGSRALVSKGIDKAERALSKGPATEGDWQRINWEKTSGPDSDNMRFARTATDTIIDKGAEATQKQIKGISAQQLNKQAAQSVAVPTDRAGFLRALKDAPFMWQTEVVNLVPNLFDGDLEYLANTLPRKADEMVPSKFRQQVDAKVTRFQDEVLAVNTAPISETRPVQVITGHGPVRHALVRPETRPDNSMHGEWKGTPKRTGKWTFVRWIHHDMQQMARLRAMRGPFAGAVGHADPSAGGWMKAATDASFWDEASVKYLAAHAYDAQEETGDL